MVIKLNYKEAIALFEPKLISPLLDQFAIGSAISEHDGVFCYPAMREGSSQFLGINLRGRRRIDAVYRNGTESLEEGGTVYYSALCDP